MSLDAAHALVLSVTGVALGVAAVALRRSVLGWHVAAGLCWLSFSALLGRTGLSPPTAPFVPGVVDAEIETWRGSCGDLDCTVEAVLVRCRAVAPASCPALGQLMSVTLPSEPPLGARVAVRGRTSLRARFDNPGPTLAWPDTRPRVRLRCEGASSVKTLSSSWPSRAVGALRWAVRHAFDSSLAPPHNGIGRALLLGEASAVDSDLNSAIRRSGVSHVLAVSGMHVTVLVGALVLAARALMRVSPLAARFDCGRWSAWLGVALGPSVAWVCGGSPSAVRAALTSTLAFLMHALGRRPDALAVASLAVVLYGVVSPRDALHPGFVLSVLATAALLASTGGGTSGVRAAFHESVRAWLSTIPMLGVCFGEVSVISLAANLFLLPIGALLIPLAVLHLFACGLGVAQLLGTDTAFSWSSGAFVGASRTSAAFDPGFTLPPLAPLSALALTGACLAAVFTKGRPRTIALLVAALVGGLGEWWLRNPLSADEARITFFDVGQGDSTLIELGSGQTLLIDGGGADRGMDPGARVILPALRSRRISKIDVMVMSHAHPDHYGGLAAVIDALPVSELWQPGDADGEELDGEAHKLVERARARGTRVRRAAELCRAPRAVGTLKIATLSPCPGPDAAWEANDNSLLLRITHGTRLFLFPGDLESAAEANAVSRGDPLRAHVLKVPHHGSRTSSTPAFLAAVRPRLAVISAGFANRHGHPHAEVSERLERVVPRVLLTALRGGVELRSDGGRITVSSADGSVRNELLAE